MNQPKAPKAPITPSILSIVNLSANDKTTTVKNVIPIPVTTKIEVAAMAFPRLR